MSKRNQHTDLNKPVTMGDLLMFRDQMLQSLQESTKEIIQSNKRQFYTIEEFAALTGLTYTAINRYCIEGTIKATQLKKGGNWSIYASELDRMKEEAVENHFSQRKSTTRKDKAILKKLGFSLKEGKV